MVTKPTLSQACEGMIRYKIAAVLVRASIPFRIIVLRSKSCIFFSQTIPFFHPSLVKS